jgi:hypothetical protein
MGHLLFAVVLSEIQPVEDVSMPGLQVDGKGSFPLATSLINIPATTSDPSNINPY